MTQETTEESSVKYPQCTVELTGVDRNAVAIFRKVRKELINHLVEQGWDRANAVKEGDAFQEEATSGDYDNVLATCFHWVNVV